MNIPQKTMGLNQWCQSCWLHALFSQFLAYLKFNGLRTVCPSWTTRGQIHGNSIDVPWNYHGRDISVSIEFSYHFAHVKFPWFVHHGYSMENRETNPWRTNHRNFIWAKLYENSIAIPWKPMGCDHDNSMEFPWYFHIILPTWNFHGLHAMGIPWNNGSHIHGNSMDIPWK